jgi:hypothetical protein
VNGDGVFELDGTGLKIASMMLSVFVFSDGTIPGTGEFTREREPEPGDDPGAKLCRPAPAVSARREDPSPDAVELVRG